MEKGTEKEKNLILMVNLFSKENILMGKYGKGQEKNII